MVIKKLNTVKKRKDIINNLFKKDKNSDMILMNIRFNNLYESPGETVKNVKVPSLFKIVSVDKAYKNLKLQQIIIFRKNSDPRGTGFSKLAGGAPINVEGGAWETSLGEYPAEIYLYSIVYRPELDIFSISRASTDDINIGFPNEI